MSRYVYTLVSATYIHIITRRGETPGGGWRRGLVDFTSGCSSRTKEREPERLDRGAAGGGEGNGLHFLWQLIGSPDNSAFYRLSD